MESVFLVKLFIANYHNAGILAGVWPCGTITMLDELFGAESKGQVYGHLHSYLFDNESSLSTLDPFIL